MAELLMGVWGVLGVLLVRGGDIVECIGFPPTSAEPRRVLVGRRKPRTSSSSVDRKWNTEKLGMRIGVDVLAAGMAGGLVAPVVGMIDRGIMENASGRATLRESLKGSVRQMVLRPGSFFGGRPFGLIFTLYFGTYLTANLIDTASSTLSPPSSTSPSSSSSSFSTTTSGTPKFLATSTTNLALCLYKDSQFTRLFGPTTTGPKRPVPLPTFILFTTRDLLTIFASFNLPPLLAPTLSTHLSTSLQAYVSAASVAQFVTPAAVQIVSTPLHLLGLDLYNRQGAVGGRERVSRVLRDWGVSVVARMGRIVPAFGVGGVVNMKVRREGMEGLERGKGG
ncbi:hypothetical protein P154DRAFT_544563 [Amniculicola lignicola CBS 123094]|uniref:Mitochondrial carrier n=1 Tax=Amniculicola lignicola CBS 123094 TaxID=1392246 RepID=A0A6A5WNB7_9PLEO|nr:hypothetical protein P154DRAFT_544563 [Amniculicola lignicola CBS 123094]